MGERSSSEKKKTGLKGDFGNMSKSTSQEKNRIDLSSLGESSDVSRSYSSTKLENLVFQKEHKSKASIRILSREEKERTEKKGIRVEKWEQFFQRYDSDENTEWLVYDRKGKMSKGAANEFPCLEDYPRDFIDYTDDSEDSEELEIINSDDELNSSLYEPDATDWKKCLSLFAGQTKSNLGSTCKSSPKVLFEVSGKYSALVEDGTYSNCVGNVKLRLLDIDIEMSEPYLDMMSSLTGCDLRDLDQPWGMSMRTDKNGTITTTMGMLDESRSLRQLNDSSLANQSTTSNLNLSRRCMKICKQFTPIKDRNEPKFDITSSSMNSTLNISSRGRALIQRFTPLKDRGQSSLKRERADTSLDDTLEQGSMTLNSSKLDTTSVSSKMASIFRSIGLVKDTSFLDVTSNNIPVMNKETNFSIISRKKGKSDSISGSVEKRLAFNESRSVANVIKRETISPEAPTINTPRSESKEKNKRANVCRVSPVLGIMEELNIESPSKKPKFDVECVLSSTRIDDVNTPSTNSPMQATRSRRSNVVRNMQMNRDKENSSRQRFYTTIDPYYEDQHIACCSNQLQRSCHHHDSTYNGPPYAPGDDLHPQSWGYDRQPHYYQPPYPYPGDDYYRPGPHPSTWCSPYKPHRGNMSHSRALCTSNQSFNNYSSRYPNIRQQNSSITHPNVSRNSHLPMVQYPDNGVSSFGNSSVSPSGIPVVSGILKELNSHKRKLKVNVGYNIQLASDDDDDGNDKEN